MRLRFDAIRHGVTVALLVAVAGVACASAGSASAETSRFLPWTEALPAAFVLKDLAGSPTSMADYHGKVVIVSFWATWCEFCREQMLAMRRLREQLAGRPFEIVAVNYGESPAKVRQYVRGLSVDFPVILDPSQEGARGRGGCGSSRLASWWRRTAGPATPYSASSTGRAARPSRPFASCYPKNWFLRNPAINLDWPYTGALGHRAPSRTSKRGDVIPSRRAT